MASDWASYSFPIHLWSSGDCPAAQSLHPVNACFRRGSSTIVARVSGSVSIAPPKPVCLFQQVQWLYCMHFWSRLFHLPVSPDRHRCSQFSSDWRLACSCVEQKIPCSRSRNRLPQRVGARPIHSLVRQGPSCGALRHHARCIRSHEAAGLVSPFHELVDPVQGKMPQGPPSFCPDSLHRLRCSLQDDRTKWKRCCSCSL